MGIWQPPPYRVKRQNKWVWVYPEPEEFLTKRMLGIGHGNNHQRMSLVLVEPIENRKKR